MAYFDLPLDQLRAYKPTLTKPDDFDKFWSDTLAEVRTHDLNPRFDAVENGLKLVESFDVTFAGYGGQDVRGWLILPRDRSGPLPCLVEYIGYGGGRGYAFDHLVWANAGYAHFIMDTRGQGSSWRRGDTPDIPDGGNPSVPGFMTQGILDPKTYYYRRVYTDAVRAVEAARSHDAVDASRVITTGGSQGGGITIATSALVDDLTASMPDVPFLCHFDRVLTLVDTNPYKEIGKWLQYHRDQINTAYKTVSYFDGMNLATKANAPALYSTALMDMICPPSSVFAAFNHLPVENKQIEVYPFNGHEGGGSDQMRVKLGFVRELFG